MRIVAVVQARMGSTRLPGKVLEPIGGRPIVLWTVAAAAAVPGVDRVVVATTTEPADDPLVALLRERNIAVHRGPLYDVLTRAWEAIAEDGADFVVRATADNPFMDPVVVGRQIETCMTGGFDYVGARGWPLGIAAEVARADALGAAFREATDPAEREHVMPFLYARPERFRIGSSPPGGPVPDARFTVDTAEDLAFARAVAERLGTRETVSIDDLARILEARPELAALNSGVRQKGWQEVELA